MKSVVTNNKRVGFNYSRRNKGKRLQNNTQKITSLTLFQNIAADFLMSWTHNTITHSRLAPETMIASIKQTICAYWSSTTKITSQMKMKWRDNQYPFMLDF